MNESSFVFNQTIQSVTTNNTNAAVIFIVVVLVWYSLSFVLLMGMSNTTNENFSEYSKDRVFRENHNQDVLSNDTINEKKKCSVRSSF